MATTEGRQPAYETPPTPVNYTRKIYRLIVGIVIAIVLFNVAWVGVYAFWQYQLIEAPKAAAKAKEQSIEAQIKEDGLRALQQAYKDQLSSWNDCIAHGKAHEGQLIGWLIAPKPSDPEYGKPLDPNGDRWGVAECGIRPTPPLIGADGNVIYPKYKVTLKTRKYGSGRAFTPRTRIVEDATNAYEAEINAAAADDPADDPPQVDWKSVVVEVVK